MNEELNFKIRAIAEGLEQATKKASADLNALGKAYEDTDNKAKAAGKTTDDLKAKKKEQAEASQAQKDAEKEFGDQLAKTAAIAAAAALAFRMITASVTAGINAFNQYTSAIRGLQSVASGTGQSMAELQKISDKLTKDGLMTVTDVSGAIKNLLMYGYTAEQAADILDRLKDSAAYNRQAHYSLGEAVRVTTEGIRMENSILSDAAGVQKNIAKMYLEYAQSIGKSSDALTQSEKAQAVYNGIMTETNIVVGNAAKYAQDFAGQQAAMEASQRKLNAAYGEAVSGGLAPFVQLLTGGSEALTEFVENNRVLVAVLVTMAATVTGLITLIGVKTAAVKLLGLTSIGAAGGVTTLGAAMKAMWVSAGPVGWVIAGISLLVGVVTGISAAAEDARKKAAELREEIESMADSQKGAAALVAEFERISNKAVKTADDTQRMVDIRAELVESYGFAVDAVDAEGRLLAGNLEIMKEQLATQKQILLDKMQSNAGNDERLYNDAINKRKAQLAQIADLEKKIANPDIVRGNQAWSQDDFDHYVGAWKDTVERVKKEMADGQKDAETAAQNIVRMMVLKFETDGKQVPAAIQSTVIQGIKDALQKGLTYDEATANAQKMFDMYFTIDSSVVKSETIPMINDLRAQLIAALTVQGADTGQASALANTILNSIIGDSTQQEALRRIEELRSKIADGLASTQEIEQFDRMQSDIVASFNDAIKQANASISDNIPGAAKASSALTELQKKYAQTADQIRRAAVEAEAAQMTLKDAASDLRSVVNTQEQLTKTFTQIANVKGAIQAIREYETATSRTAATSKRAAEARQYLAETYGIEKDAIAQSLPGIEDDIALKEALAIADYAVGMQAALTAQSTIQSMVAQGRVTSEQGAIMIAALDKVIGKMAELASSSVSVTGTDGNVTSIKPKFTGYTPRKSGGSSSAKNAALERELSLLEHKKNLDQITTDEEIKNLERILAKYAKTTDEKRDLIERLYDLRMEKQREELEYQKAMDQLTLREEITAIEKLMDQYKVGTAERRELEKEHYALTRELQRQEFDLKVYYGQMTLDQQEEWLRQMIDSYEIGTEARIELEKQLFDVQQQARQQNIDRVNTITDAIVTALENRYNEQRRVENERLKESSEAWRAWGEEQVSAIQAQIDALDEMTKSEDRSETERKKRREIAMLEQQLLYENDAYNRQKIMEQLAAKQDDLNKWLARNEREGLKESLRDQIDAVNATVGAEQDKIDAAIDANDAYYDELTRQASLQAEAAAMLMNSGQEEILALLQSFAPDYNLTGQTLGEQLYDGFVSKVGDIETWFTGLTDRFSQFRADLDSAATAAANQFYATHGTPSPAPTATPTGAVSPTGPTINMYFNSPVTSPTEIRREMERLAAQLAQM